MTTKSYLNSDSNNVLQQQQHQAKTQPQSQHNKIVNGQNLDGDLAGNQTHENQQSNEDITTENFQKQSIQQQQQQKLPEQQHQGQIPQQPKQQDQQLPDPRKQSPKSHPPPPRQMRIKDKILQKKRYLTSRNSISSVDSLDLVRMNAPPTSRKKWTTLDSAGRSLLVLSTVLLLAGIIVTVFGFVDLKVDPSRQLPMQIIGPACLMATAVMWVVGGVFCRLWTIEMRRQKHSMELRTRVQLHALAMDMLKKPQLFSSQALEDPRIRRQLLMKLRQQNALDTSSLESTSRKSSRVPSIDARSRLSHSSIMGAFLPGIESSPAIDRRRSTEASIGTGSIILPAQYDLPGIHISRIETLDFDDMSMLSGFGQLGPRRYIIIESDGSSDYSKMSVPNSECSFSMCSRSSRSRSSRDSSNFGSRIWDFSSPRESDWEVNIPYKMRNDSFNGQINPRHSSLSSTTNKNTSFLSPSMPRKGSTVTFDQNDPTARRHSSPASSFRKKEGRNATNPTLLTTENNYIITNSSTNSSGIKMKQHRDMFNNGAKMETQSSGWLFANQPNFYNNSTFRKKSAGDQSLMSMIIDENDGDEDEENTSDAKLENESIGSEKISNINVPQNHKNVKQIFKSPRITSNRRNSTTTFNSQQNNVAQKRRSSLWQAVQESYEDSDGQQFGKTNNSSSSTEKNDNVESPEKVQNQLNETNKISEVTSASDCETKLKSGTKFLSMKKKVDKKLSPDKSKKTAFDQKEDISKTSKIFIESESDELNSKPLKFSTFAASFISNFYNKTSESNASESDNSYSQTQNNDSFKKVSTEKSKIKTFFSNFVK